MREEFAIRTQNLIKNYGKVKALRGLNLEVPYGEIYGFLGPNGAGKTTTIRCLLDLIRPNGGSARVLGMDPRQDPLPVRASVGYLPGELHFFENMRVSGALHYLNRLRKGQANPDYIHQLAERLNLDLEVKIKNLSKGNKQKMGVIQALMHRPPLLMLDEPTAGLDPLIQQEVLNLVSEAKGDGATVFFSSHNLREVEKIADRVGIIRKGILVEVAEPAALIKRSLLRASIRFKEPIDSNLLESIPGVHVLSEQDRTSLRVQVEGEMGPLIQALASLPVILIETERPSLEEIFLVYYQ
jgi:ABC-2 type transport system ATP-binding protein